MKQKLRVIGIDDAPFEFKDDDVLVVGSIVRAPNYLEGILSTRVKVDGVDATDKLIQMISSSRFADQPYMVLTDGAALGGFNLIDLKKLWKETGIPAVSISRDEPDFESIKRAMKEHLPGWRDKYKKIKSGKIYKIETEHKPIFVQVEGSTISEVERIIKLFTIRGRIPEPIRMSHIVASGIVRGESKGKP
ncbi:MAG: DUF99 family protein [Candidatus Saliniplasma sp.]